jgi:pilus assembly protein Flp/PilA
MAALWRTLQNLIRAAAEARPIRSETGVTAIEYGLIAALIAIAIVAAVTQVGTRLSTLFNTVSGHV